MESPYSGKYFSILGDSISTLEGFNPDGYEVFYDLNRKYASGIYFESDTWWGSVIDKLGGKLLVNGSFSGSKVCCPHGAKTYSCGCGDERTSVLSVDGCSPDVIIVFMGTNDWGAGMKLYPESPSELNDMSIFSVAYSTMLDKLKRNYPEAKIWCFTLGVSCYSRDSDFVFPYEHGGIHIEKYCEVIRECAHKAGCRVVDMYSMKEPFDTIDGFHPSYFGMQAISEHVLLQLAQPS